MGTIEGNIEDTGLTIIRIIPWTTGEGNISVERSTGSGDGSFTVRSDINEGLDREQTLTVKSTDNKVSKSLTVSQAGKRTEFQTSSGDIFITSDDEQFITLK